MSSGQFSWSDEQVQQRPQGAQASSGFSWSDEEPKGKDVGTATIGVNRGPQTSSPGYRYSTGYAGEGDAPRDSGGFVDRMTTQAGRALSDPRSFIPSWKSLFPPLQAYDQAKQEWDALSSGEHSLREDPARTLGSMAPAALTSLITHGADAIPNPVKAAPEVVARSPIWRNLNTEGTPVPSVLEQPRPNAIRPSPRPVPQSVPPPASEAPPVTAPTPEEAANNARFIQSRQQPGVYREPPNALNDKMTPQEVDAWQESVFNKKPENVDIGAKVRAKNPEPTRAEVRAARTKAPAKTAAPASNWPFSFPPAELNARLAEQMKQIATAEQPLPTLEENPEAPPVQTSRPLFINGKVAAPTEDLTAAMEESLRRTGKTKKPVQ